jgi:hypothetical protein
VLRRYAGHLQALCDDALLFDVPDAAPLPSGKVGISCIDNGVMVARARIWYQDSAPRTSFPDIGKELAAGETGAPDADPYVNDFSKGVGAFHQDHPKVPVLVTRDSAAGNGHAALKVTNECCGSRFGLCAVDKPFVLADRPHLKFSYRIPPQVRLNVYFQVGDDTAYVAPLTGSDLLERTDKRPIGLPPQCPPNVKLLTKFVGIAADDHWHAAEMDLVEAFKTAGLPPSTTVSRIVFGLFEPDPYLYCGLKVKDVPVNPFHATYWLADFSLAK